MEIQEDDISQIKKDISDLKTTIYDSQVDFLGQKRDFELFGLPSCGAFYSGNPKTLYIGLLTYYEELLLTKPYFLDTPDLLMEVLRRVVKTKDFDVKKLISCDVQGIAIFLAAYSFGEERKIPIECPACNKKEEEYKFRLSSFQAKDFNHIPDENMEITVENKKHKIKFKPMTYLQEHEFNKQGKEKVEKLAANVMELDGERDRNKIEATIRTMKIVEYRELERTIKSGLPAIEMNIDFVCPYCNEVSKLPFDIGGVYFLKMPESHIGRMKEEVFLVHYYGHAITYEEAKNMTVSERNWTYSRIVEEVEKKNKAEKAAMDKAKNSSKR